RTTNTHDLHSFPTRRSSDLSMSAACASGNYAIALARRWLQMGWVDLCLAGACELAITPMTLAGFGNLRALSSRNDDPKAARVIRSEEHTSELQSRGHLVCRL